MFERPRLKVPFGGGIDRASGLVAVEPGDFADLRNLQLYEGKSQARQGVEVRSALTLDNNGVTPMDDVTFLSAFRAVRLGLLVGYYNAARTVQVFTTAATGLNPQLADDTGAHSTWGTLAVDAGRPRVFGVESQKFFFLAHDQPLFSRRLVTKYYNPAAAAGSKLVALTANLDNAGSASVLFRGVMTHLAYLVGWGYGSGADPDRAEIVRVSKPGEPLVFVPEHYFIIGTRGEPVLNCKTVGNNLLCFKETEIYAITGYDRATFGIQPVDANYGLAGSHLAVVVEGICYFWSLTGPRATDGGPSKDLGYPLDVSAPEPDDLVVSGEASDGFAFFNPDKRQIVFCFGRRSYALHLRSSTPKWTYNPYGIELRCAGLFYTGSGTVVPTGYPDIDTLTAVGGSTLRLNWTNVGAVGDETVEIWVQQGAGAWGHVNDVLVNDPSLGAAQTQDIGAPYISPGNTYVVAVRYRRATFFTDGYNSTNPADWPNAPPPLSRASIGTPAAPPPITPGTFVVQSVTEFSSAGKQYQTLIFTWTRTDFGVGSQTRIVQSTNAFTAGATEVYRGAASVTVSTAVGPLLATHTPKSMWFWLQNVQSDGTLGAYEPLNPQPFVIVSGA